MFGFIQIEIADVGQHVAAFILGLMAHRRQWFTRVTTGSGYAWLAIGVVLALVYAAARPWLDPPLRGWRRE